MFNSCLHDMTSIKRDLSMTLLTDKVTWTTVVHRCMNPVGPKQFQLKQLWVNVNISKCTSQHKPPTLYPRVLKMCLPWWSWSAIYDRHVCSSRSQAGQPCCYCQRPFWTLSQTLGTHHTPTIGKNMSIWATSWENLFMQYVNNKGADQTAHLCSLISAFAVHCLNSIIPLLAITEISRP